MASTCDDALCALAPLSARSSSAPAPQLKPPPSSDRPPSLGGRAVFQRLVSACAGAAATVLITSPLDVLKTRLQAATPSAAPSLGHLGLLVANGAGAGVSLRALIAREGPLVLWSGARASLAMALPSTALYFTAYDVLKREAERSGAGAASPLFAGVTGRVLACTIVAPLELIRTQEMAARSSLPLLSALRREVAAHGGSPLVLWRGFAATLWRDVPFSGIYWLGYEAIKARATSARSVGGGRGGGRSSDGNGGTNSTTMFESFAVAFTAGVVSGSVAALVTTPFDVIKTRRQVGTPSEGERGTFSAFARIARDEGASGLFAGWHARVAKVAPSCAIMIATYEIALRLFASASDDR